ncbi:MAG TPA: septum formation inhibitor Maf [Syntrophomonas sp.]|nr:septum formation inhibitor Maf [Syntrophomonas sp.]
MRVVLASQSPRRKTLLELIGLRFSCNPADVDESFDNFNGDPAAACLELAASKARAVAAQEPEALIIAADTIVVVDNRILGKPRDKWEAFEMLSLLSGREHRVITGLCVLNTCNGSIQAASEITRVRFRNIQEDEIWAYIASGEPLDKAGSYGAQGLGAVFVDHIDGCFYNVVGLPLHTLYFMLKKQGLQLLGGVEDELPCGRH